MKNVFTYLFISLLALATFSSCSKKTDFSAVDTPVPILTKAVSDNCVQVFYDKSTDVNYKLGRTYALMLLNLLGHFPEFQQIVGPIELYQQGDLDKCKATFYIGSYYDNTIPQAFLDDYKTTDRQVVWMGYNYWKLAADFENTFGYHDYVFTKLDNDNKTSDGKPGFFRDILYKGETFVKYNQYSQTDSSVFVAAFEMTKLTNKTSDVSEVMAQAQHSTSGEVIPWALKANNKFYVTEIPFSYIHEADRYMVFADLLFDFLKAPARHNAKNALIRLEDIDPYTSLKWLKKAVKIMRNNGVTPHISIIPIFRDPLYFIERADHRPEIRMEEKADFFALMQSYSADGTVFIWHGVTHQYNDIENPFSATSGDDYEFWNAVDKTPLAEDSVTYVLDKLDKGFESLKLANITPVLWLTPHYHASPLDDVMFGQMFDWVVGRCVYSDFKIGGVKALESTQPLSFDLTDSSRSQNRREFFSDLQVNAVDNNHEFGQIYPYELYGNIYAQRVIPENLGNVQPYLSEQVTGTRTVETMLADARRNLVLRDVWASAFYHPFLLDPNVNSVNSTTGATDLEKLVTGLQSMGYKFISMNEYALSNKTKRGSPRVELEELRH
jgi:uncharacterized protein YdaL